MKNGLWWTIITILFAIIIGLAWVLFTTPTPTNSGGESATSTQSTASAALHERVVVSEPASGASVSAAFTVKGEAPGNWFFEASFPIKVVDAQGSAIGQGIAQAAGEWMTTEQVPFSAEVTTAGYSGPATLVLLRDNPSGLPENNDALEIPITIQ